ncbi:MAG: hypothetical protein A4E19_17335 [Nitrospira sp. SG-bin1]|nr:MAG: hypothetical protein A4E19_17335 [Nitrospira sp. SG-bin1]
MASRSKKSNAAEIDRLALAFAKEPGSKVFIPLAEEYGKAGMWEEAAAVLEDGLKTYPGFITAMVALGRAYEQMDQPVKAKAILEEAVKLSPENLRAHRTLAKLYVAQGAREAAIRSCNVILSINPHDQEALSLRAGFGAPTADVAAESHRHLDEKTLETANLGLVRRSEEGKPAVSEDATSAMDDEVKRSPHLVRQSQETLVSTVSSTPLTSEKTRNPVIMQLEQWLNSIQARRRYPRSAA